MSQKRTKIKEKPYEIISPVWPQQQQRETAVIEWQGNNAECIEIIGATTEVIWANTVLRHAERLAQSVTRKVDCQICITFKRLIGNKLRIAIARTLEQSHSDTVIYMATGTDNSKPSFIFKKI